MAEVASKADKKSFRRFVRGGGQGYKVGVRHIQRFVALGWIDSRLENPFPGLVRTTWFVTPAGLEQLPGGKMP